MVLKGHEVRMEETTESCRKEHDTLLEKKKKEWQENKYKQLNPFIKTKDVRKMCTAMRDILKIRKTLCLCT